VKEKSLHSGKHEDAELDSKHPPGNMCVYVCVCVVLCVYVAVCVCDIVRLVVYVGGVGVCVFV